jgi:predicted O-methyltransferase YrrM
MDNLIFDQVDRYISDLLAPEDTALTATTNALEQAGIPNASISASQGKFLQVLAMACQAKKILELGTLGGYSTIWLARMLPEQGKVIKPI